MEVELRSVVLLMRKVCMVFRAFLSAQSLPVFFSVGYLSSALCNVTNVTRSLSL